MDYIMLGLFVMFMFFIFGGYHQNKFEEREAKKKKFEQKEEEKSAKDSES